MAADDQQDTSFIGKAGITGEFGPRDSQFHGMSVRSIITLIVVGILSFHTIASVVTSMLKGDAIGVIQEPFYGITYVVIGYYFGQQNKVLASK